MRADLGCRRNAVIIGPSDTPFDGGTFRLVMQFEETYPNKPPGVKFVCRMFHPNVYATGELCLDILQNRWSPTYDVAAILTSIQRYGPRFGEAVLTVQACSTIRTPARRPTWRRRRCTRTTRRSTTSGCRR